MTTMTKYRHVPHFRDANKLVDQVWKDNEAVKRAMLNCMICCICAFGDRYGIREFVVISPGTNCEAIISESKCNLLLSSISISLANSGW